MRCIERRADLSHRSWSTKPVSTALLWGGRIQRVLEDLTTLLVGRMVCLHMHPVRRADLAEVRHRSADDLEDHLCSTRTTT
jgi:hypothetical protein